MATVYSDQGLGVRAPVVFYNRCNEAAAHVEAGRLRLEGDLWQGVRWFHSGGIFSALSETTSELVIEALKEAKRQGGHLFVRPELSREAVEDLSAG